MGEVLERRVASRFPETVISLNEGDQHPVHRVTSRNYGREPRSRLYCPKVRKSFKTPDDHDPKSATCQGCGVGFPGLPLQDNPYHDKLCCRSCQGLLSAEQAALEADAGADMGGGGP